jgi:hypothetical protein
VLAGNVLSDLLIKCGSSKQDLTHTQRVVDHSVEHFAEAASDYRFLGGHRWKRRLRVGRWVATEGLASCLYNSPHLLRGLASLAGISAESLVFSEASRFLKIAPLSSFGNSFAATFISLSSLRVLGSLSRDQNLLVQHLFTDLGMVAGHQLSARFGLSPSPEGTLADQLLQAETLNWQMKTGMALTAEILPQPRHFERGLELSSSNLPFGKGTFPFLRLAHEASGKNPNLELSNQKKSGQYLMVSSNGRVTGYTRGLTV